MTRLCVGIREKINKNLVEISRCEITTGALTLTSQQVYSSAVGIPKKEANFKNSSQSLTRLSSFDAGK